MKDDPAVIKPGMVEQAQARLIEDLGEKVGRKAWHKLLADLRALLRDNP